MNRSDLQILSKLRIEEAKLLLNGGLHSGAYYLAGYSVECALKACIARRTARFDFPDRIRVQESYTHDLSKLLKTAALQEALRMAFAEDLKLARNWDTAVLWSEGDRYELHTAADAERIIEAISQTGHGVLPWLMQHW